MSSLLLLAALLQPAPAREYRFDYFAEIDEKSLSPWIKKDMNATLQEAGKSDDIQALIRASCEEESLQEVGLSPGLCETLPTIYGVSAYLHPIKGRGDVTTVVAWTNHTGQPVRDVVFHLPEGHELRSARVGKKRLKSKVEEGILRAPTPRIQPDETVLFSLVTRFELPEIADKDEKGDPVYQDIDQIVRREIRLGSFVPLIARRVPGGEWDEAGTNHDLALFHVTATMPTKWGSRGSGLLFDTEPADDVRDGERFIYMDSAIHLASSRNFGLTLLQQAHYKPAQMKIGDTLLQVLHRPSMSDIAGHVRDYASESMRFHGNLFGHLDTEEIDLITDISDEPEGVYTDQLLLTKLSQTDAEANDRIVGRLIARQYWAGLLGGDDDLVDALADWSALAYHQYRTGEPPPFRAQAGGALYAELRDAMGEHRFVSALRRFARGHRYGWATLESLQDALREEATDPDAIDTIFAAERAEDAQAEDWGLQLVSARLDTMHVTAREAELPVAWRDQRCHVRWLAARDGVPDVYQLDGCTGEHRTFGEGVAKEPPGVAAGSSMVAYTQFVDIAMKPSWTGLRLGYGYRPVDDNQIRTIEVRQVREGSPAAGTTLRRGDLILTVDGEPVYRHEDVWARVRGKRPGQVVQIGYQRGRRDLVTVIEVEAEPDAETFAGAELPDFDQVRTWNGRKPRLPNDTRLVLFFTTDCEHCMLAVNAFIQEAQQREDLSFVGVSEQEPRDVELGFPPNGPVFQTISDPGGKFIDQFPALRLPTMLLADGDTIAGVWFGLDSVEAVKEALVERLGPLPIVEEDEDEDEDDE